MACKVLVLIFGLCVLFLSRAYAQEKVVVSHSVRGSLSLGPLLYGIHRGFYKEEGIDLLYVSIRADLGLKALLSGDVDYIYSAGTVIRGAVIGVPVKGLTFDFTKVFHSLMARPEITSAAALKGKKVAVSSFGATGDLAARVAVQALGLDPNKDVTFLALGPDTLRYTAIQSGTVQATHMPLPFNIRMKKEGFNELLYVGKILNQPLTGLATSMDKIQKNPEQIRRMVRAFVRASRAFKNERAEFVAFAQKKFSLSKDVTEEAYDYLIDALSQDGFVDEPVLQRAIDDAKKSLGVSKPVNQVDVVDYSFLRAALKR